MGIEKKIQQRDLLHVGEMPPGSGSIEQEVAEQIFLEVELFGSNLKFGFTVIAQ